MEKHSIEYRGKTIPYELERKNVKNVNVNIKPDMTVKVTAGNHVPEDFIKKLVERKAEWILKHIHQFAEVQPARQREPEYVSGETFKYLGKQYQLRVHEVPSKQEETVKYVRGYIHMYVNDKWDMSQKERLIQRWYRQRARKIFFEMFEKVYPKLEKYGVEKPILQIRAMKARWGSAQISSSTILLNAELVKAPKPCIEYVILHELVHFKYNDHSENFYYLLYSLMPDWEKRKGILDEEIVQEIARKSD